jgi:uncharacterized protein (DUF1330 family)
MAKGYWVVNVEVTDLGLYNEYRAFVGPFLAAHGGRFITRGGQVEVVEGTVNPRVVVVEFPSYAAAVAAYHSAEYTEGKKTRLTAGAANFAIVEGID